VEEIDKILDNYETAFIAKVIYNVVLNQSIVVWTGNKRVDYFSGGSIAFTKDAFEKIGGMCEKFYGYGSEDCEFWQRVKEATKLYENRQKNLLHVNHKRINSFSQNVDIYNEINSISMEDRIKLLQNSYIMRKSAGVIT
jgi:predicted glycosyltransferase involved in capsule biosynthesis